MTTTQPAGAYVSIGTGAIADQLFSADGSTLYTAHDGTISVFSAASGALVNSWAVGTDIRAMDVSADGKTLYALEGTPGDTTGTWPDLTAHYSVYQIDLATGHSTTLDVTRTDSYPEAFTDLATLADGTVVLGGGQWNGLTLLDPATGTTTVSSGSFERPTLMSFPDHSHVLVSDEVNAIASYNTADGFTYGATDSSYGYSGVEAVSPNGNFIVQSGNLAVMNGSFDLVATLSSRYQFDVAGLVFSADSSKLYVLDANANEVFALSTETWDVVAGYAVGASVGGSDTYNGYGGQAPATSNNDALLISADGTHLAVNTAEATEVINLGTAIADGPTSASNDVVTGNSANNVLYGFEGNDTLDGKGGDDLMIGGTGNDTYYVDSYGDAVTENHNGGNDTVHVSFNGYTQPYEVETMILDGPATDATGNGQANIIDANNLGDEIYGLEGDDTLNGGTGNDRLDGGAGNDHMVGGKGDDTYVVDSPLDVVVEKAGEGTDTIQTSISLTLATNVENGVLAYGTQTLALTGNALDNTLTGNDGDNVLDGGAGHDTLVGRMGDDTYMVDSAHDKIVENANEGLDTVIAAVSWTLGDNLENLTLSGTRGNTGTGNALDNHIIGNAGDNMLVGLAGNDVLDGGLGHDTLVGGTGNDLYFVDSAHDTVVEKAGEGNDTVVAAVSWTLGDNLENLTLSGTHGNSGTGNALDNTITGNSGDNHLSGMAGNDTIGGGDGNDVLLGGAGRDVMTGGAGNDHFVFAALSDFASAKGGSADEITDFATGDKIDLSSIDAIPGGGHNAFGWLGTGAFDGHAGELRFYEQAGSTYIQADLNGDKVTDFAIKLDGVHALTAADFVL